MIFLGHSFNLYLDIKMTGNRMHYSENEFTKDTDPAETAEWLAALDSVVMYSGLNRAAYLANRVASQVAVQGAPVAGLLQTAYVNSLPSEQDEPLSPEEEKLFVRAV